MLSITTQNKLTQLSAELHEKFLTAEHRSLDSFGELHTLKRQYLFTTNRDSDVHGKKYRIINYIILKHIIDSVLNCETDRNLNVLALLVKLEEIIKKLDSVSAIVCDGAILDMTANILNEQANAIPNPIRFIFVQTKDSNLKKCLSNLKDEISNYTLESLYSEFLEEYTSSHFNTRIKRVKSARTALINA